MVASYQNVLVRDILNPDREETLCQFIGNKGEESHVRIKGNDVLVRACAVRFPTPKELEELLKRGAA